MSTTSLKITDELKERAASVARKQGVSTHAFLVEAIISATEAAEKRADFVAQAKASLKTTLATGKAYDTSEVHAYIRARIAGENPSKPKASSWRD